MDYITEKFARLGVDNAPGQEKLQKEDNLCEGGVLIEGPTVDFSHGDVDVHKPIPGCLEEFVEGYVVGGGGQAYTEYRGRSDIRAYLSERLTEFSGAPVDAATEIILTPGTQGALFLAMGSLIGRGDKVAIVAPDYFANRKLVEFFDGELVTVPIRWEEKKKYSGLDITAMEEAFKGGVKLFLYSNPNNPTGVIYSPEEVSEIGRLADKYGVTVIADELYSRQILADDLTYTHLRACSVCPPQMVTIIGPSKTESLSGFRLGVAYGSAEIITRMEKLQAIVSLRAAGYCQSAYRRWFSEPEGWMSARIADHRAIRDDIMKVAVDSGMWARSTEGGSYIFLRLPKMTVNLDQFVKLCRKQANVIVTPGTEFGKGFSNYVRLNFSQDHNKAVAAVKRLCLMAERYKTQ